MSGGPVAVRSDICELCCFLASKDVLPPYHDAHKFVMEQHDEHFNDLKHALKIMKKISDIDDMPSIMSQMFLLEEGALRFVTVPKVCVLHSTTICTL